MSVTPLALLKAHARVGSQTFNTTTQAFVDTPDPDDVLLQHYLDAAEEWILNFVNGTPADLAAASLKQAAVMLAAYWFEQRETAIDMRIDAVPFGVLDLVAQHRKWSFTDG